MATLTGVFQQLLSMAVTVLPVMAVVLLVRALLKKAPKKYGYLLWLVVAFRLVCPVALESPVGIIPQNVSDKLTPAWTDSYVGSTLMTWNTPQNQEQYERAVESGREPIYGGEPGGYYVVTAPDGVSEPATVGSVMLPVASVVWLLGMVVVAAYLVFSALRLWRQVAAAVRQEDNVWECESIPTPFVLGLLRPRIYIPFRMTEQERAYILAHERYHIRCRDHWAKLLGLGILTVYWWNPSVWLCWVLFCRDMEMRCDEAVLAQLGSGVKRDYSLSLVSFALDRRAPMALAFGEHDAAKRVKNVLKWKKAKPVVVFLAVVAVVAVVVVCGTNAMQKNWLKIEPAGNGVQYSWELEEPVYAWAIYEEIYEEGKLLSSSPRIMDAFVDGGGVSERKGTSTLTVQPVYNDEGGFVGELQCAYHGAGGITWTLSLPRERYTGMGSMAGTGNEALLHRRNLPAESSTVLYTVLLSTEVDGGIRVYPDGADTSILQSNDTVVQYRLVTSTEDLSGFNLTDLAGTLYQMRLESLREASDAEPLLEALGVESIGNYTLTTFDSDDGMALRVDFDKNLTDTDETRMWEISCLLLALVRDVTRVDFSYYKETTGNLFTYYCDRNQPDSWAENMGYADIKAMGETPMGIRALLKYIGWDTDAEDAGSLPNPSQYAVWFQPEDIRDIERAELVWWDGQRFNVQTGEGYEYLEERLGSAAQIGATACPFASAVLYLQRADGTVGKIIPAADSCDVFLSDGKYYQYGKRDAAPWTDSSETFYAHFGMAVEDLPAYTEPGLAVTSASGDQIGAAWYADGVFNDSYDDLPTLTLTGMTTLSRAHPYALTLEVSDAPESLTVGEDYYAATGSGTQIERNTYALPRNEDGTFTLNIRRRSEGQAENAVYYIPYGEGKFIFRVMLPGVDGTSLTDRPFHDILGYDGVIRTEGNPDIWTMWTYYAQENGKEFPIAESFGFGIPEDYSVDVDDDGVNELVTNVQFGGDGHQDVYVYQRRGDEIWRGTLDLSDLPNHDDWGVNSTSAEYDPVEDVFRVRYSQKNTEETGMLETHGLERFTFTKYSS